jgi:hypothetical protein
MGNLQVRLCDQEMQVWTVGDRPTEVKVRSLVAWIAGRREIEFPKPIDKAIFRMVSKSSGRNESERGCGQRSPPGTCHSLCDCSAVSQFPSLTPIFLTPLHSSDACS